MMTTTWLLKPGMQKAGKKAGQKGRVPEASNSTSLPCNKNSIFGRVCWVRQHIWVSTILHAHLNLMGTRVSSGIVKFLYDMVDGLWLYTIDGLCGAPCRSRKVPGIEKRKTGPMSSLCIIVSSWHFYSLAFAFFYSAVINSLLHLRKIFFQNCAGAAPVSVYRWVTKYTSPDRVLRPVSTFFFL